MAGEWFFASLRPNVAKGGWGAYDRKTGAVVTTLREGGIRKGFLKWVRASPCFIFARGSCIGCPAPSLDVAARSTHKR